MFSRKEKIFYKDWLSDWLKEKREYIKESTYANYSNNIYNYIIPYLGDYYLHEINHKVIQDFILYLSKSGRRTCDGGLSEKTIKDITVIMKSSLKKGMMENRIDNFELKFKYPKSGVEHSIQVLSNREQNKLTDYVIENLNNKSIGILLTLYSGIRIGELCALKWSDIDFKRGILHINKTIQRIYLKEFEDDISKIVISTPKTKSAIRDIPINKSFLDLLRTLKGKSEEYILTGTTHWVEPRSYRRYFDNILRKNKIKHLNFHALRHTFATNCISLGVDYKTVSELLGHTSVNITLNLYVHPRLREKKKCIDLICKVFHEKVI